MKLKPHLRGESSGDKSGGTSGDTPVEGLDSYIMEKQYIKLLYEDATI